MGWAAVGGGDVLEMKAGLVARGDCGWRFLGLVVSFEYKDVGQMKQALQRGGKRGLDEGRSGFGYLCWLSWNPVYSDRDKLNTPY